MIASPSDAPRDQLTGWKDIATYLGKSVRTVQRWEQRYGLPVHRVPGSAEVVLASKGEIDRWKRSEASLEIEDIDRGEDAAPPAPGVIIGRPRVDFWPRWLIPAMLPVLVLVIVVVHLGRSDSPVTQAEEEDDAALFEPRPIALEWTPMEGQRTSRRQPDGVLVDPGFVTLAGDAVVFNYVKADGIGRARPYVFARLRPAPQSPRLRFRYVADADARVSHWAGFIDPSGFVRKGEEAIGYWVPQSGIALRLDRTNQQYVNSRMGIWLFAGGEPRLIGTERRLSFQLEPRKSYPCTLEIDGWRVTAVVSDGTRVDTLVETLDAPLRADGVFVADADDGVSSASPRGTYDLRFEAVAVRDAVYKVDLALSAGSTPAAARGISLAILSNRYVDATALDQSSLSLSALDQPLSTSPGARVLAGSSGQGFACRSDKLNPDGVYDLVCDFDRQTLRPGTHQLRLGGRTTYGRRVAGRLTLLRPLVD